MSAPDCASFACRFWDSWLRGTRRRRRQYLGAQRTGLKAPRQRRAIHALHSSEFRPKTQKTQSAWTAAIHRRFSESPIHWGRTRTVDSWLDSFAAKAISEVTSRVERRVATSLRNGVRDLCRRVAKRQSADESAHCKETSENDTDEPLGPVGGTGAGLLRLCAKNQSQLFASRSTGARGVAVFLPRDGGNYREYVPCKNFPALEPSELPEYVSTPLL